MLLISDANILIDFDCCDLLDHVFQLPDEFAVPDILFEEELKARHPQLPEQGLGIRELAGTVIADAMRLKACHRVPSSNDLLALALARAEACPLLTGDRQLRLAAEAERVPVHGTLWLAERLLDADLTDPATLRTAFARMRDQGRRLPWKQIDTLLDRHTKNS